MIIILLLLYYSTTNYIHTACYFHRLFLLVCIHNSYRHGFFNMIVFIGPNGNILVLITVGNSGDKIISYEPNVEFQIFNIIVAVLR